MKKLTALLLAGVMVFSFAACGNTDEGSLNVTDDTNKETEVDLGATEDAKVEITDAADLLTKVWETYDADTEKFSVMGGDANNIVDGAPGKFDYTKAEENGMESTLCFPLASVQFIDDAASLVHAMMANNFTCGAYHLTQPTVAQPLIDSLKAQAEGNQWMCGQPETLLIVTVGEDYVVSAFGAGDIIETFKTKLTAVYGEDAVVAVEQSLFQ